MKLQDIIRPINKHDALVKIHEDFIRGKNSKVEENFEGWNGDGTYVVNHVQTISSSKDKYLLLLEEYWLSLLFQSYHSNSQLTMLSSLGLSSENNATSLFL